MEGNVILFCRYADKSEHGHSQLMFNKTKLHKQIKTIYYCYYYYYYY